MNWWDEWLNYSGMLLSNPIWNLLARWRACLVIAGLALGLVGTGSRVWAQVEVPALKGDGIFTLLRRHGLDPESNLAEFRQLNGTRMAPGDTLIEGRRYVLPGTASDLSEPLFGSKLSRVKRLDDQLRGAVFYLVNSLYRKDTSSSYRRCFSIHVDARSKATDIDIFFYYQSGDALGKRLALTMRDTIRKN